MFSLRDLPDELKPIATLLTLDTIWRTVTDPVRRRPRLVIVDEAWLLMRQPAGADFLARLAKSARKHWAGLTVATQDTTDLLGSPFGRAVVTNAATQILLRQAPQAIDEIATVFGLSGGERQFLLSADRGQGLLCAGHRTGSPSKPSPPRARTNWRRARPPNSPRWRPALETGRILEHRDLDVAMAIRRRDRSGWPVVTAAAAASGLGDWFGDYLRDPAGTVARTLDALTRFALTYGPVLAPTLLWWSRGRWSGAGGGGGAATGS